MSSVRPDAIISFGTLMSAAGVLLGSARGIPVVLHEQNVALGKANGLLRVFARKVALSFPPTLKAVPEGKGLITGNILREEILSGPRRTSQVSAKKRLLILGGSQGASVLNRVILEVFERLSREEKEKIAVYHITGRQAFSEQEEKYRKLGIESEVFSFTDEMPRLFAAADMVIARAGAGTIAEILFYGLPSILVPYPYAASHQLENARFIAKENAAILIEQKDLTAETLKAVLNDVLSNEEKMKSLGDNASRLAKPDAGQELSIVVETLIQEKRRKIS